MINKGFSTCPPSLWINLWESRFQTRQVLDFWTSALACPIWQQSWRALKIKHLALLMVKLAARRQQKQAAIATASKMGTSQARMHQVPP